MSDESAHVATHFMAPRRMADNLRLVAYMTRIRQADLLRDAVSEGLKKYGTGDVRLPPAHPPNGDSQSILPRLPSEDFAALVALAEKTRVRQSEYLRLFLAEHLEKHSARLQAVAESEHSYVVGGSP